MKNKPFKAALAATVLSMVCAATAQAQQLKVGYVDMQLILRDANPAKAAQTRLESEFAKRGKELQDLDARLRTGAEALNKAAPTLSDADRTRRGRELDDQKRELDRKAGIFQEDLDRRRTEETAAISERIDRQVKQIFDAENYDLILRDNVPFHSQSVDITKRVIDALNAQK